MQGLLDMVRGTTPEVTVFTVELRAIVSSSDVGVPLSDLVCEDKRLSRRKVGEIGAVEDKGKRASRSSAGSHAVVFCYSGETPFVNDELCCAKYISKAKCTRADSFLLDKMSRPKDYRIAANALAKVAAYLNRSFGNSDADLKRKEHAREDLDRKLQ